MDVALCHFRNRWAEVALLGRRTMIALRRHDWIRRGEIDIK